MNYGLGNAMGLMQSWALDSVLSTYQVLAITGILLLLLLLVFGSFFWRWLRRGETAKSALLYRKKSAVMKADKVRPPTITSPGAVPGAASEPTLNEAEIVAPPGSNSSSEQVRDDVVKLLQKELAERMGETPQQFAAISALEVLIADVRNRDVDKVRALGHDRLGRSAVSASASASANVGTVT